MKLHCLLDPLNLSKGLLSKWDKSIPWSQNISWQRRLTNSSMWPASFIMLCTVRCSPSTWALERSGASLDSIEAPSSHKHKCFTRTECFLLWEIFTYYEWYLLREILIISVSLRHTRSEKHSQHLANTQLISNTYFLPQRSARSRAPRCSQLGTFFKFQMKSQAIVVSHLHDSWRARQLLASCWSLPIMSSPVRYPWTNSFFD